MLKRFYSRLRKSISKQNGGVGGRRGTEKSYTLPLVSIMKSNVLTLLCILYYLKIEKKKKYKQNLSKFS